MTQIIKTCTQEEIEHLNIPVTLKLLNYYFKNFQKEKPRTNGFTGEFYQTFKEDFMLIIHKRFQK